MNKGRLKRELQMLTTDPPHGVTCIPKDDQLNQWEVNLVGGVDTPYEGGVFKLDIQIPQRYPFEPPQVRFLTKIYHPNIDDKGQICLDVLKMPPMGSWKPAQNLSSVLTSIQLLLAEANPDDGLMAEISHEYKQNRPKFLETARQWVLLYARDDVITDDVVSDDVIDDVTTNESTRKGTKRDHSPSLELLNDDNKNNRPSKLVKLI